MPAAEHRSFEKPDEVRTFPLGRVEAGNRRRNKNRARLFRARMEMVYFSSASCENKKLRSPSFSISRLGDSDGRNG